MTKEERKAYDAEYRAQGFGRIRDKRYRLKHLADIRERDRARKRASREAHDPSRGCPNKT